MGGLHSDGAGPTHPLPPEEYFAVHQFATRRGHLLGIDKRTHEFVYVTKRTGWWKTIFHTPSNADKNITTKLRDLAPHIRRLPEEVLPLVRIATLIRYMQKRNLLPQNTEDATSMATGEETYTFDKPLPATSTPAASPINQDDLDEPKAPKRVRK